MFQVEKISNERQVSSDNAITGFEPVQLRRQTLEGKKKCVLPYRFDKQDDAIQTR